MKKLMTVATLTAGLLAGATAYATSYDAITAQMDRILADYPEQVSPMDIGTNDQGQLIRGLRIEGTNNGVYSFTKPKHLMMGVHHGNEQLSADVSMQVARDMIEIMRNDEHPLNGDLSATIMYVVPVLNISGYNANRREESSRSGGTYDPNRDYPDACDGGRRFKLKSTQAIADFVVSEEIVGAVTAHGYIGTFTYPFGMYTDNFYSMDDEFFEFAANKVKDENNYRIGTHGDIVYPAAGTFEDWAYVNHGVWSALIELKRSANIEQDSRGLLGYFAALPAERSIQHELTGDCRREDMNIYPPRP